MPMGIVSDAEFLAELEARHEKINRGRGNKPEVPAIVREIIAEAAIVGTPSKQLQDELDVSASSISAYKNGATSTASYNEPNESLAKANDKVRTELSSLARTRLLQALNHITPEKLAEAKLRDVASVAKDMSAIVKDNEGAIINPDGTAKVQFIFHVPKQRKESEFEIIDVTQ